MTDGFVVRPGQLTLADLRRLAAPQIGISLTPEARPPQAGKFTRGETAW